MRVLQHPEADLLVAAGTASGKTEAAFLPLLNEMTVRGDTPRTLLYVSPLKALINDQCRRFSSLCEELDIALVVWHGDKSQSIRRHANGARSSLVLITPESLEVALRKLTNQKFNGFHPVSAVIIDELHTFVGTHRGVHLWHVLRRLSVAQEREFRRVGLSATLGSVREAQRFINRDFPDEVQVVQASECVKANIDFQVIFEYEKPAAGTRYGDMLLDKLYSITCGTRSLVFPNSKSSVEELTALLAERGRLHDNDQPYFSHHASLPVSVRTMVEARIAVPTPCCVIATSTLEMGIDLPLVEKVVQVGVAPSVASLRQRLGRSNRENGKPTLSLLLPSESQGTLREASNYLHYSILHAITQRRLALEGWVEPPASLGSPHSVRAFQVASLLHAYGKLTQDDIRYLLGLKDDEGYSLVGKYLQGLAKAKPHGVAGNDSVGWYLTEEGSTLFAQAIKSCAAFSFENECSVRASRTGQEIGKAPALTKYKLNDRLCFSGQYWAIERIEKGRVLYVTPAAPGPALSLSSRGASNTHAHVRQQILQLLRANPRSVFSSGLLLDRLQEAHSFFHGYKLGPGAIVEHSGGSKEWLLWEGDMEHQTLAIALSCVGFPAVASTMGVLFGGAVDAFRAALLQAHGLLKDTEAFQDALASQPLPEFTWSWLLEDKLVREEFDQTLLCRSACLALLANLEIWPNRVVQTLYPRADRAQQQ